MANFKIIGNQDPEVGKKYTYSISMDTLPSGNLPRPNIQSQNQFLKEIRWSIYILEYGKWYLKKKNNKVGAQAEYTFYEISLKREGVKIVAELGGEKATLEIKPQKSVERKIVNIELCDALGKLQKTPFGYNQTILARVHCLNLDYCSVHVTLWEDDAPGKGHSAINKNNKVITLSAVVQYGMAEVKFRLSPDFIKIANAGKNDEGKTHEYYVTAEIFRQETKSSNNINVINPDHKDSSETPPTKPTVAKKQVPAESKGESKKDNKGISKPSENKIYDWWETTVNVVPIIFSDPVEYVNSLMKVNVGDPIWNQKKGSCVCKDYDLVWGNKVSCEFRKKVVLISKNLGLPQIKNEGANWLMAVMALETIETFDPSIKNKYGYTGLIQIGDAAANTIGTTTDQLKKMTDLEQLDYVEKHFKQKKVKLKTLTDLYLSVLYPSACGHGNEKNYVVLEGRAYKNNPLFFKEDDEYVEKINKKGKKIKERGPKEDGKTYVWEVAMAIQSVYDRGKKFRVESFGCNLDNNIKSGNCLDTWDATTNKRIALLHPQIRCAAKNFINEVDKTMGIKLRIIQGFRTFAEQDILYAQGRTTTGSKVTNAKGGESNHNFGLAIDVAEIKDGTIDWNEQETLLPKIAPIGKKWGFKWGGDWKSIKDKPHFEMMFDKTIEELLKLYQENGNDYTKIKL